MRKSAAGADAVVQHLVDRALHALHVQRADAEHDEAEVADARVGHQLLHVGLHHRHQRAVDDADDGQRRERRARSSAAAVGNSGKANRTRPYVPIFRSTPARMTEPAVGASTCASGSQVWNGKSGTLIANASVNARKNQNSRCGGSRQVVELQQVEAVAGAGQRVVHPGQADDRDEHQHAAGHRVEDELDGRVDATLVAPDPDQEVHRDRASRPRRCRTGRGRARRRRRASRSRAASTKTRELLHLLVHRFPRRQQRQRREEAGEHEQEQADAVHADVVLDAERRDPVVALDELEVGARRIEAAPEQQRRREHDAATRRSAVHRTTASRRPSLFSMSSSSRAPASGRKTMVVSTSFSSVCLRSPQEVGEDHHRPDHQRRGVGANRPGLQQPQPAAARRSRSRRRRSPRRR